LWILSCWYSVWQLSLRLQFSLLRNPCAKIWDLLFTCTKKWRLSFS
jgi:hypothetical protein